MMTRTAPEQPENKSSKNKVHELDDGALYLNIARSRKKIINNKL